MKDNIVENSNGGGSRKQNTMAKSTDKQSNKKAQMQGVRQKMHEVGSMDDAS